MRGKRRLIVAPAALDDLQAIYAFSVERFGEQTADQYLHSIRTAIETIEAFPEISAEGTSSGLDERELPVRSHVIRYAVQSDSISILRVIHVRANR